MRRFSLLVLLVLVGLLPVGCGSKTSPTSSSNGGGSSSSLNYIFAGNFGQYNEYGWVTNPSTYCGGRIPQAGTFGDITGVAVGGGYIFVGDNDYEDIQVFDMSGNYVTFFWPYDTNGNSAESPEGMTVANNKLYVADQDQGDVDVYNIPDIIAQANQADLCNEVYAYGTYWTSNMDEPVAVAVDASGKIYVTDSDYDQIYVFNPDFNDGTEPNWGDDVITYTGAGAAAINSGNLDEPTGIAVDPAGQHVYVGDYGENVVQVYSFNGTTLTSTGVIGSATGAASTITGQFDGVAGVCMDNQGNLIVADNLNSRVQRLTTSGSVLNVIGASATTNGALASPAFVAVDSNNKIYVTDNNYATVDTYTAQ